MQEVLLKGRISPRDANGEEPVPYFVISEFIILENDPLEQQLPQVICRACHLFHIAEYI